MSLLVNESVSRHTLPYFIFHTGHLNLFKSKLQYFYLSKVYESWSSVKRTLTHTLALYSNSEKIHICSLKLTCVGNLLSPHISVISQCLIHTAETVQNEEAC